MDAEIYDKAHAILLARRREAEAENDRRIREINDTIPEIREINNTLFASGRKILDIIRSPYIKDVNAEIEKVKRENLGAQEAARKFLVEHGYRSDYLDMHYTCPYCNDTGYINDKFCDCMKKLFGRLTAEKLNQNAHLELSGFDTFRLDYYSGDDYFTMKRIFSTAKNYAENFTIDSGNLIMLGDTGLGKTHLSLAIASTIIQKGYSVIYDSVINILLNIEHEHFGHERSTDVLDSVLNTDLLILDDLGVEQDTKFYNSMIYNIINTRIIKKKPTIISTNLDLNDIDERYSGIIASRVAALYTTLRFKGRDVRLQIAKEKKKI